MNLSDDGLLDRVNRIYEAALEPDLWPGVLRLICDDLDGESVLAQIRDKLSYAPLISSEVNVDPEGLAAYADYYYKRDLWAQHFPSFNEGGVYTSSQLVPKDVLDKSEFLNDFLRSYGGPNALFGIPLRSDTFESNFTIIRKANKDAFEIEAQRYLRHLMPHVKRAYQVGQKLGHAQSVSDAVNFATTCDTIGVVAIGHDGQSVFVNDVAKCIFQANDGLYMDKLGIHALNRNENDLLQRTISVALAACSGVGTEPDESLAVSRPSLKRPYTLFISPLSSPKSALWFALPRVVVIVKEPEVEIDFSPQTLKRAFGLTPREAMLVAKLFNTTSLKETAEQMGITGVSAREYLKRVFYKTDTHSQAELVKLLSRYAESRS
jgi:DNA-binding CsgD family transcriptional regulator